MTNAAAIGYMILAAKKLQKIGENIPDDLIRKLERMMYHTMDMHTEEEAERVYQDF